MSTLALSLHKIESLFSGGKIDTAIKETNRLLAQGIEKPEPLQAVFLWAKYCPTDGLALFWMAKGFWIRGQQEQTLKALDFAAKLVPDNAEVHMGYSYALRLTGNLGTALHHAEKSLALNDKDLNNHTNYIDVLADMGLLDEAEIHLDKIASRFSNASEIDASYAYIYGLQKAYDKALPFHQKSIAKNRESIPVIANYMNCLEALGLYGEAISQARKADKLFTAQPALKNLHPVQWRHISTMISLADKRATEADTRFVTAGNLENPATFTDDLSVIGHPHGQILLEGKNIQCYSSDWTLLSRDRIYFNHRVIGNPYEFTLGHDHTGQVYIQENFPKIIIEEKVILIGGASNYYHWIIDFLPKLALILGNPGFAAIPLIFNHDIKSFQYEALAHLGVTQNRIFSLPEKHIVTFKHVVIPHIPGRPMLGNNNPDMFKPNENPFIPQWLRENFIRDEKKPASQRIFISRGKARFRRCLNEDHLMAMAVEKGFKILENDHLSFQQQIDLYAETAMIIGVHGAGFTNSVFCPPGAKMIELLPKGRKPPFYSAIARQLGHDYASLDGPIHHFLTGRTPDFGDFTIDEKQFKKLLDTLN